MKTKFLQKCAAVVYEEVVTRLHTEFFPAAVEVEKYYFFTSCFPCNWKHTNLEGSLQLDMHTVI